MYCPHRKLGSAARWLHAVKARFAVEARLKAFQVCPSLHTSTVRFSGLSSDDQHAEDQGTTTT
jgi:hypothetical protein